MTTLFSPQTSIEQTDKHKHNLKGIYAITDENLISEENFIKAIEAALQGGVRIIQYRDKSKDIKKRLQQANNLRSLCTQYRALCIINDDIELATKVNADGVHLGKEDIALGEARKKLGDDKIIGISCYNDINLALAAEKNSATYVAFGAMFSSPTKPDALCAAPDIITRAKKQISIPICAIGGINENNIQQLTNKNTDMVAVISSLFSSNNIEQTANSLSRSFNNKIS